MSFILDALKKSETERQRQGAPGIASIPETGQKPGNARWPWIVGGLLVINLVVLATIMMRAGPAPGQSATVAATPAPASELAPETFSESVRESGHSTPPVVTETAVREAEAIIEMPVETVATLPAPARPVTEGLPTFNELRANGQLPLPDMHLDIHVYSDRPADRFVFVNMSKYTESATLSTGLRVSEIVPDGVVLDYMGTRFLLPRE
jgi:general secretion pathway protein B